MFADFMGGMVIGAVAGAVAGVIAPLVLLFLMPRKPCPKCGERLSRFRNCWDTPKVVRRCVACGCGVDAKGRKVGRRG